MGGGWQELLLHLPILTAEAHEAKDTKSLEEMIQPAFAMLSMVDQVAKEALRPPPSKRQLEMTDRMSTMGDNTTTPGEDLENN
jgi:hypothetical protein